jgi:protein-disulfide isomerase
VEVKKELPPTPQKTAGKSIKIEKDDPVRGKSSAKVVIVEYADYQCPFCGAFSGDNKTMVERMRTQAPQWEPLWPKLQTEYIDSGKVVFIFKDFAFLDDGTNEGESHTSAQAAHCAGEQNKYWEYHSYLFAHQQGENKGAFTISNLKEFAKDLELDQAVFDQCLESGKYAQKVLDSTEFASGVGVNGTPALFINGKLLTDEKGQTGAFPYSFIKEEIEKELAR